MFTRRYSANSDNDTPTTKKHYGGRGLGPFSGSQLTVIIVTILVLVAFPFAAGAVTGNNIFVTDATSGAHAKVDATGALRVGGAVGVSGLPKESTYFRFGPVDVTPTSGCRVSTPPLPSGKALIVTMLHVDIFQAPASPGTGHFLAGYADTSCTKIIDDVNPSALGITALPLTPGIATTTGVSFKSFGGDVSAEIEIIGYLVSDTAVPPGT
jgi:hypothetical protein